MASTALRTDRDHETRSYAPMRVQKPDKRSKLIKARAQHPGDVINACPYGCPDEALDAKGYCKHLIGFTDPEDIRVFYPQTLRRHPVTGKVTDNVFTDGSNPQETKPTDFLVEGTMSFRVYRESAPKPLAEKMPERLQKPEPNAQGEP